MKNLAVPFFVLAFASLTSPAFGQAFIASGEEQYNIQVGASQTAVASYGGFNNIDGLTNLTGATVSVNGGGSVILTNDPAEGSWSQGDYYATEGELLAAQPINGTYAYTLSGSPSGAVTVNGPAVSYGNAMPPAPVFTIDGVSGTWATTSEGYGFYQHYGAFHYDPDSVTSFTVTMSAYSATTQGDYYAYWGQVGEISSNYTVINEFGSDIVYAGGVPPSPSPVTLTFTKDLPPDAGDSDPLTFGFTAETPFEVEAGYDNIFGLTDSGLSGGVALKAFYFESVTVFQLLPWPAEATAIVVTETSAAPNSFTLSWDTAPAGASVDVYRSEDMLFWTPVSLNNVDGTFTDTALPGPQAFYRVVSAGAPLP